MLTIGPLLRYEVHKNLTNVHTMLYKVCMHNYCSIYMYNTFVTVSAKILNVHMQIFAYFQGMKSHNSVIAQ